MRLVLSERVATRCAAAALIAARLSSMERAPMCAITPCILLAEARSASLT